MHFKGVDTFRGQMTWLSPRWYVLGWVGVGYLPQSSWRRQKGGVKTQLPYKVLYFLLQLTNTQGHLSHLQCVLPVTDSVLSQTL